MTIKAAISFSGQPCTYQECIDTFINNVYNNTSKCFGHFWWDESYLNKCFKMHYNLKLNDKDIVNKLIDAFNIFQYKTEPYTKIDLTYVKKFNFDTWKGTSLEYNKMMTPILLYGVSSQLESINKSIKLIDKTQYDVIIRARPDLIYMKDVRSIIKNLNFSSNTIFIQSSNTGGHLYGGEPMNEPCDWFYMGSPDVMVLFAEKLKTCFSDKFKHGIIHLRDFIKSVAKDNEIKLELIDFGAVIYKQTSLFNDEFKNKIDVYSNDFDIESMTIKTPELWPYWIHNVDFQHFKNFNY